MKKTIITIFVILIALACWYSFAPIKWVFGLRAPKDYNECMEAGGEKTVIALGKESSCTYKSETYKSNYLISF